MSKREKRAYFRHVFVNNFFRMNFFLNFSTDSELASNSAFFDTHTAFLKNNFFEVNRKRNGSKKRKTYFINVS
jgi:hypothetical protein